MLKKLTLFFHCLRQAVALSTSDLDKFFFAINSFNSSIGKSTISLWVKGNPIGTSFSSFRRPPLKVFKIGWASSTFIDDWTESLTLLSSFKVETSTFTLAIKML